MAQFPMVKVLHHSLQGDNYYVQCVEINHQGARGADFEINVPAYDQDNEVRPDDDIVADINRAIKARYRYAIGRAAPNIKLPEFIEVDAEPEHAKR